jgi:hypothetical protein
MRVCVCARARASVPVWLLVPVDLLHSTRFEPGVSDFASAGPIGSLSKRCAVERVFVCGVAQGNRISSLSSDGESACAVPNYRVDSFTGILPADTGFAPYVSNARTLAFRYDLARFSFLSEYGEYWQAGLSSSLFLFVSRLADFSSNRSGIPRGSVSIARSSIVAPRALVVASIGSALLRRRGAFLRSESAESALTVLCRLYLFQTAAMQRDLRRGV